MPFHDIFLLLIGFIVGALVTLNNFTRFKAFSVEVEAVAEKKFGTLKNDLQAEITAVVKAGVIKEVTGLITGLLPLAASTATAAVPPVNTPPPPVNPGPAPVPLPSAPAISPLLAALVQGAPPAGVQPPTQAPPTALA